MDVSRETQEALRAFCDLVAKWTKKINLVAPGTVPELYERHALDSLQLMRFAPNGARLWADLGSGGGFPGIVAAIALKSAGQGTAVHLVESDQRKAAFLRTASRELDLNCTVHAKRIEDVAPLGADVVSARALSPLPLLLAQMQRHAAQGAVFLAPKGRRYREEVAEARESFAFDLEEHPSMTDPEARILVLTGVSHAVQ